MVWPAAAETCYTFQQHVNGYAGCEDAGISANYKDYNYGALDNFTMRNPISGVYPPALIQFNEVFGTEPDQVPTDATITSAVLRLHVKAATVPGNIRLYPMYSDWVEGDSDTAIEEGASCYNARRYRSDGDYANHPEDAWGTDGAVHDGPVRYVDYPNAYVALVDMQAAGTWMEFDITETVQDWQDGTLANNGLYGYSNSASYYASFWSSEYGENTDDESLRPQLVVTCTVPVDTPQVRVFRTFGGEYDVVDTMLQGTPEANKLYNYGGYHSTRVTGTPEDGYKRQGLIRFENIFGSAYNQVPYTAIIEDAVIRLCVYDQSTSGPDEELRLYPMYTGWQDGSSNGSSEDGAACYSYRAYRSDGDYANHPEDAWGTDGAVHTEPVDGVDYDTANRYSYVLDPNDNPSWMEIDITDEVLAWQKQLWDNYGFYVYTSGYWTGCYYRASEATSPIARPALEIQFVDNEPLDQTPSCIIVDPCCTDSEWLAALELKDHIAGLTGTTVPVMRRGAETVTFQQGLNDYSSCADTLLRGTSEAAKIVNYGSSETVDTYGVPWGGGKRPSLIRFGDLFGEGLYQVPTDAAILSAEIELYVYSQLTLNSDDELRLYPMYSEWTEGTSDGSSEDGASCYSYRAYRSDGDYANHPEDAWDTDGAVHDGPTKYGVDYDYTDKYSHVLDPCDTAGWISIDITDEVQAWQAGSCDNNGFYVYLNGNWQWCYFYSSEYSTDTSLRPRLVVTLEDPCGAIIVGQHPNNAAAQAALEAQYPLTGEEDWNEYGCNWVAFAKVSDGYRLRLVGNSDIGVLYGAYDWLEDQGIIWFMPDPNGTYIPSVGSISYSAGTSYDAPAFNERYGYLNGPLERHRKRCNPSMTCMSCGCTPAAAYSAADAFPNIGGGHSYEDFLDPAKYGDYGTVSQHPEWYNLVDDDRLANGEEDWQICFTNADAAHQFALNVIDTIGTYVAQGTPVQRMRVFVSPNDDHARCDCDNCQSLVDDNGAYSSLVLHFANTVATEVRDTYPEARIYFYAYDNYATLPDYVDPCDGVNPEVVFWTANTGTAANHAKPMFSDDNVTYSTIFHGWYDMSETVSSHQYYGHYKWVTPWPQITQMINDIPHLANLEDCVGMASENHMHWGSQMPNFHLYPRLMWNPYADANDIMDDFYTYGFGPAASYIEDYFDTLQTAMDNLSDVVGHLTEIPDLLTSTVISTCDGYITSAAGVSHTDAGQAWRTKLITDTWIYGIKPIAEGLTEYNSIAVDPCDRESILEDFEGALDYADTDQGKWAFEEGGEAYGSLMQIVNALDADLDALPVGTTNYYDLLEYGGAIKFWASSLSGYNTGQWGYKLGPYATGTINIPLAAVAGETISDGEIKLSLSGPSNLSLVITAYDSDSNGLHGDQFDHCGSGLVFFPGRCFG